MIHGLGCSFLTQKPDSTCVEFFVNCISHALQLSQAMVTLKRESKILQNQKKPRKTDGHCGPTFCFARPFMMTCLKYV